jgi:cyclic dehypoxanthinyl futalosine synthase
MATDLRDIERKAIEGSRLTAEDAARLLACPDLPWLGAMADLVRRRKHPGPIVTYVIGRNVNYTNVCTIGCRFCAFHRPPGHPEAYVLSREELFGKLEQLVAAGGAEVLMQGGCNPALRIEWFEDLFRSIKQRYPVHLHALSPTEILHIARISGLTVEQTITRLRAAGLDTIPGGGGEILVDEVRRAVSPRKDTTDEWLGVMRAAHNLGMRTTATMMYGSIETPAQRIEHLLRIRDLQDDTGGFTAFIPWSFQPHGTPMGGARATGYDYLRTVAVARLVLDNVENIQASWVTQGPKIAQISLRFGVNDFGSTMFEEHVVRAAGTSFVMSIEEIERQIRQAGYQPLRRDTLYTNP